MSNSDEQFWLPSSVRNNRRLEVRAAVTGDTNERRDPSRSDPMRDELQSIRRFFATRLLAPFPVLNTSALSFSFGAWLLAFSYPL